MSEKSRVPLCLDGRMLGKAGTGVSTYAAVLETAQAQISDDLYILDSSAAFLPPWLGASPLWPRRASDAPDTAAHRRKMISPDLFRRAHVHFGTYGRLLTVKPTRPFGIMHWTYPVPLRVAGWINIYAIHDAIPLLQTEYSDVSSARLRRTFQAIAKVADKITTISEASMKDLAGLGIFEPDRIRNTSLAIDPPSVDPARASALLAHLNLPEQGYFIFCGMIERRKNLARLLEAFRLADVEIPLVVVGPTEGADSAIDQQIRSIPRVIRLPYQTADAIGDLISNARALLFPSLAEGFGLPAVEAMARGTPVMASKIPALAEVAGNAALLVDPLSVDEIGRGIRRLASDDKMVEELKRRGLFRSRKFSLESFQNNISDIYMESLSERK